MARFIGHSGPDAPCYHAKAILHDASRQTCNEHSFILPSEVPTQSLKLYSFHFDPITGIIHVASRCRYFSLKEALEIKGSTSSAPSKYAVEFSNGNMTAIRRARSPSHRLRVEPSGIGKSVPVANPETRSTAQATPRVTNQHRSNDVSIHSEFQRPKVSPQHDSSAQSNYESDLHLGSSYHNTSCLSTIDSSILKLGPVASNKAISRAVGGFVSSAAFSNAVRAILAGDVSAKESSLYKTRKPTSNSIHSRLESTASNATSRRSSSNFMSHQNGAELEGDIYTPLSSTFSDHSYGNGDNASKQTSGSPDESHEHMSGNVEPVISNVMAPVNRAIVQALPSFTADLNGMSRCCEALQLMRPLLVSRPHTIEADQSIPHLDLAPLSQRKELAHKLEEKFRFGLIDDATFGIRLDDASGELYLPSSFMRSSTASTNSKEVGVVEEVSQEQTAQSALLHGDTNISQAHVRDDNPPQGSADIEQTPAQGTSESDDNTSASQSILRPENIDLDAEFPDQDEYDITPYREANVADSQTAAPPSAPTSNGGFSSLDLRPHLLNETVDLLQEVHTDYSRIWVQANPGVYYDCATYDPAIEQQAIQLFESKAGPMPIATRQVVNAFIKAFLKIWREGHRERPGGRWITGEDEPYVSKIAVDMVEWGQMVFASVQTRGSVRLQPGSMVLEESPSSWEWYVSRLGGDSQYCEHRRTEVEEPAIVGQESERAPVHHINFNGHPVYERSYTPPEVSFWAAATTYDKIILGKALPCVHPVRVIASQAFRWVDPTRYIGNDISSLWRKKGSAMKNAATSDIQVVYQAVGTWGQDRFSEDDTIPEVAPTDLNYEFATNGNYNVPQLPYFFNMLDDENRMFNINEGKPSEYRHCRSREYNRDRPSLLRYEVEAEPLSSDEGSDVNDEEVASEAQTEIQSSVDQDHEPVEHVDANEAPQGEVTPLADTYQDGQASQSHEERVNDVEDDQALDEHAENTDIEEQVSMEPPEGVYDEGQSLAESDDDAQRESESQLSTPGLQLSPESNFSQSTPLSAAEPVEPTGASMIAESMAFLERIKANPLNRPPRATSVESEEEVSFVESEKESFDGDNGITDHKSEWPTMPEPAEHRNARLIARFTEDPNLANLGDLEQSGTDAAGVGPDARDDGGEMQASIESNESTSSQEPTQDGRYTSSSNALRSAMREASTPPQSPPEADEDGSFTPLRHYPSVLSPISEESSSTESSPVPQALMYRPSRVTALPDQPPSSAAPIANAEVSRADWRETHLARYAERPPERSGLELVLWQGRSQAHTSFPGSMMPQTFSTAHIPALTGIGIVRRVLDCSAHLARYAERPQERSGLDLVLWEGRSQAPLSFLGSRMRPTFSAAPIPAINSMGIMQRVLTCSITR